MRQDALGALSRQVVTPVLARIWLLVGIGITAGAAISVWASRLVGSLLYGLPPNDPVTLVGAATLLLTMGTVADGLRRDARHARIR